jgi:hypothetical protein
MLLLADMSCHHGFMCSNTYSQVGKTGLVGYELSLPVCTCVFQDLNCHYTHTNQYYLRFLQHVLIRGAESPPSPKRCKG